MKPDAAWFPVHLEFSAADGITLNWMDLQGADFNAPFFEDILHRHRGERRQSHLREFGDFPLPEPVPPTAFIFHASRSGSTLLSQLLACLDGTRSLSEPPILDEVFQLPLPDAEKIPLLRQIISALGQRGTDADQRFFIKFDSWHLPWLEIVRSAFPQVQCYFLYRHPVEILWSHHRQRGSQMIPELLDPAMFGIAPDSFDPADLDAYAARVLGSIFSQALHRCQQGILIPLHYGELLQAFPAPLTDLGIVPSPSELMKIARRSEFHGKRPGETYQPEIERIIPESFQARLADHVDPILMPMFIHLKTLSHEIRPENCAPRKSQKHEESSTHLPNE
jgi:hypothetical protein